MALERRKEEFVGVCGDKLPCIPPTLLLLPGVPNDGESALLREPIARISIPVGLPDGREACLLCMGLGVGNSSSPPRADEPALPRPAPTARINAPALIILPSTIIKIPSSKSSGICGTATSHTKQAVMQRAAGMQLVSYVLPA